VMTGFYGTSDDLIRTVGAVCRSRERSPEGGSLRTATGGVTGGRVYTRSCPPPTVAVGVVGRAGSLVDALGLVCDGT
jgi:hypothetical protein